MFGTTDLSKSNSAGNKKNNLSIQHIRKAPTKHFTLSCLQRESPLKRISTLPLQMHTLFCTVQIVFAQRSFSPPLLGNKNRAHLDTPNTQSYLPYIPRPCYYIQHILALSHDRTLTGVVRRRDK